MKIWDLPGPGLWDAQKFAIRYGLNSLAGDFYVDGNGKLVVRPMLPDDPPIFELPDPPVDPHAALKATMDAAINPPQGPQIDPRVKAVLVELRKLI